MKLSIVASALLYLVSLAYAAPSSAVEARQEFEVGITFTGEGSDPSTYFQQFPTDNQPYPINNPLIVSQISSVGGGFCVFTGADGSSTVVYGEETVDVVPPQVQIQGDCDSA